MQKIVTLLFIFALSIVNLASCKQDDSGSETAVIDSQPSSVPSTISGLSLTVSPRSVEVDELDRTITPSSSKTRSLIFPVPNIPPGYISSIRWSEQTEQTLFFTLSDDSGNLTEWAYNLSDGNIYTIDRDEQIKATPDFPPETTVEIPVPFERVSLSPSGEKAIFFEGRSLATLTPLSESNGKTTPSTFLVNVWVWDRGSTRNLGQIEVCGRNKYFWTANEQLVAIQATLFPSPCRQATAWLIDIVREEIAPLLSFDEYGGTAELVGFSPKEDKLLFTESGRDDTGSFRRLRVINMDSMLSDSSKMNLPIIITPIDWVDNNKVLILYRKNAVNLDRLAIADLQTGEITNLIDDEHLAEIEGLPIRWGALSPDKQWVAFTVDYDPYRSSGLWLMELNFDG